MMDVQTTSRESVVLHVTDDVPAARQTMVREPHAAGGAVVAIDLEPLPPATDLHEAIAQEVRAAATRAWPGGYAEILSTTLDKGIDNDAQVNTAIAAADLGGRVSAGWLREAASRITLGWKPWSPHHTLHERLTPLAYVFGRQPLLLVPVAADEVPGERLDALGRTLAGIVAKTPFQVHLLVTERLAAAIELDHVNYTIAAEGSLTRPQPPSRADDPLPRTVPPEQPGVAASTNPPPGGDEPGATISAMIGKPHPESPGEQRLAAWLSGDAMLAGLFEFNQSIRTSRLSTYRVDLVWHDGRVVVEVDGFRNHTTPHQFRFDRQRDYELALSGYVVLRLTHQEVMQDVPLAGEKIRDIVRLRSGGSPEKQPAKDARQEK